VALLTSNFTITDIHDYFDRFAECVGGNVARQGWEQRLALPAAVGEGTISRLRIRPGMEIVLTDVAFARDMKLRIREHCRLFELNFCESGEIYCEWNGRERLIGEKTGNVCFLEGTEVYMEKKAKARSRTLEVRMCPNELLRYAGDSSETERLRSMLERHKGSIDRYPDSPALRRCAHELLKCTYSGSMKRLYMESKAMELIALFVQEEAESGRKITLRTEDVDRLRSAREHVLSRLEHPPSIKELAVWAGMNEFKLKKGFRALFGTTVFELVRDARMERALQLMDSGRMNVGETAVSLGYSNLSNFTTAFRKQYGCNPSEYLKQVYRRTEQERTNRDGLRSK